MKNRKTVFGFRLWSELNSNRSSETRAIWCLFAAQLALLTSLTGLIFSLNSNVAFADQVESTATNNHATDSLGDPLPVGSLLRMGTVRFQHPSVACDMALSPDNKHVVTLGYDELIVWDAENGKEKWRADIRQIGFRPPAASYGIRSIAFDADSSRFYTPGKVDEFYVWDLESGEKESRSAPNPFQFLSQRPRSNARSIDITQDGSKIALGSAEGLTVCTGKAKRLFQIKNDNKEFDLFGGRDRLVFGGKYTYARFSPDEKSIAMVSFAQPKEIRIVNSSDGTEIRRIKLTDKLVRFAFDPESSRIAATERDNAVRLYDVESGKRLWQHMVELNNPMENYTAAIDFSPTANTIAISATDNLLYLLDAETGNEQSKLIGHHWYPWSVQFTSDGRQLFSTGWEGVIRRWNVKTAEQIGLPNVYRATGPVAASANGKRIAYSDDFGMIHVLDPATFKEIRRIDTKGTVVSQLAFSHDSFRLAVGGNDNENVTVTIWDLATGEIDQFFSWPLGRSPHSTTEDLEFSADSQRLAIAVFRQSKAYLVNPNSGERLAELSHGEIYGLSFSPNSQTLVTAGWDKKLKFWNAENGDEQKEFTVPVGPRNEENLRNGEDADVRMYTVCYSPNGDLIATAHMDQKVRVWNVKDVSLKSTLQFKGLFRYGTMRFSPDGLWLATGVEGADVNWPGEVTVWDPTTGQKVWDTGRHRGEVYEICFGHDSRTLLSGGGDGCCYLWDLAINDIPEAKEFAQLWTNLQSDDSPTVFHAMAELSRKPNAAVALLTKQIETKYSSISDESKKERVAHLVTSLLAQLRTPSAIRLLKQISNQESSPDLKSSAKLALDRIRG